MSNTVLSTGMILAGKYRLERMLGEGGMGMVFAATHLQLEQRVALKFMRTNPEQQADAVARFLREARAAARIQSEYIARVFDVCTLDDGSPYIVMEYLEGQDLEGLMPLRRALPVEQIVDLAVQACFGLAEAHAKGVIHRDLKPANLFLTRLSDGSVRLKLLDFGISKIVPAAGAEDPSTTHAQLVLGSPLYMSPEQLRSSTNVDPRTDIWSMGVILYEMLSGALPFDGDLLPEVCARIMTDPPRPLSLDNRGLASVIRCCLEKDAAARFPDAGALATALAPFGTSESRALAGRIVRLVHASDWATPNRRPGASDAPVALPASGAVGAGASFGTFRTSRLPMDSSRKAFVAGAAVVAGLAIGLATTRYHHADTDSPAASPALVTMPLAVRPALPDPVTLPPDVPAPSTLPVGPAPQASAPPRASVAIPVHRPRPTWRPTPRDTAAPSAVPPRPASTEGFGGRD